MQRRSGPGFFESLPTRLTTEPWGVLWPLAVVQWILLLVLTQRMDSLQIVAGGSRV